MNMGTGSRLGKHGVASVAPIVACVARPGAAHAQSLSERQVLRAPASGEGAPGRLFGARIAIDGDLAVVSERRMGAQPRGYRRVAGNWLRAPELDRRRADENSKALALSDDALVYSAER